MSDLLALGTAIYNAIGTVAGSVYYGIAPQGAALPYIVVARDAASDDYVFGGKPIIEASYVVKAVSNRQWPNEAWQRYGTAHAQLQARQLTVTGYNALRCLRRVTLEYQDGDRYWHVGGVYDIEIEQV